MIGFRGQKKSRRNPRGRERSTATQVYFKIATLISQFHPQQEAASASAFKI